MTTTTIILLALIAINFIYTFIVGKFAENVAKEVNESLDEESMDTSEQIRDAKSMIDKNAIAGNNNFSKYAERIRQLEKFLGVEFKTTTKTETGYVKPSKK